MAGEGFAAATGERGGRRWLRPLGLFGVAFAPAIVPPMVTVLVAFAVLTLFRPGPRLSAIGFAAVAFALAFAGEPTGALWYLERGWAIIVAGSFAAITMVWRDRPFFPRGLWAVAVGTATSAFFVVSAGGWPTVEGLVGARIQEGVEATLLWIEPLSRGEAGVQLAEAARQTGRVQGILFPASVALSTLASLGVAWWLHVRATTGSDGGLGSFREFRFPDLLVWLFIAGVALVLVAEWSVGWGRAGTNLMAFMGGLYVFRGLGVLLFFLGGVSLASGVLLALVLLLATPILVIGALLIGLGDSWLDLRARAMAALGDGGD